jgi:hypothetical protein
MMKRIAAIIVIAFCICYCTKPVDINLPPHDPRLVLHGYVTVGDTFKIALGKTMVLDTLAGSGKTYVNNGWVLLYENNTFLDSLKYKAAESRYVSSRTIAAPGKTYRIRAGAPGFPEIEAVTYAPFPLPTISLSHSKNTGSTSGGLLLDDIKFSFNDPAGENDFYLAVLHTSDGSNCVYTYDPSVEKYTVTLAPFSDGGNCIENTRILFTDKIFNGTLKEMTLSTYSSSLEPYTNPYTGVVSQPYLTRYHITEDYFRYYKTAINQDDIFEEGPSLTIPRMAKGNVKNGYGLFTVFAAVTDTIR